mmetsp:Transcript_1017/g.1439  ORF Transcript_1017/g.1439 Transcript_1017/m.1439 type:complete len:342 (+) Transcript_1017:156-1181(+)
MQDALAELRENMRSLVITSTIPRVDGKNMTSLRFYRDYVAKNVPVIITGAMEDWPAMKIWSPKALSAFLGDAKVTIDITPDGRGDSLTTDAKYFVTPATRKMKFSHFIAILSAKPKNLVAYCQHQNDNFTSEFKNIHSHVRPIGFAQEAFGQPPDATNIWVGDERSVSSLHRDPYENIYCVVQGTKTFTLLPPTDAPYLAEQSFPSAQYKLSNDSKKDKWSICPNVDEKSKEIQKVKWIPVDPDFPNRIPKAHPCMKRAKPDLISPIRCEVKRGELLFLPSSWFHQVSQTETTIAVNFWYDMDFGIKWALLQYLEKTVNSVKESEKHSELGISCASNKHMC